MELTIRIKKPLKPAIYLALLLSASSLCMAADWKLIERFSDLEIYYDASSVQRTRNEVSVTTLTNYFKVRNRGDGDFWSKTTLHTVDCSREKLISRYSIDYADPFAKGKVIDEDELESVIVDAKPRTVAGHIYAAVCKIGT